VSRTYLRGKIESALQQNKAAERDLFAAFTAAPHEENVALDLGLYYIRERKYEPAAEVFQKAIDRRQNSPYLWLGLGLAQFLGGLTAESLQTLRTLLSLQPDFSSARVMMAFVLYIQGKIDEAAKLSAEGSRSQSLPLPLLHPRRFTPKTPVQRLRHH
jgi:tetratricopeptide (TPR) repeat protein